MDFFKQILDILLHVDRYLQDLMGAYGLLIYAILFLIIFIETGFVVMPFLPGDSLLFATGAMAALDILNPYLLLGLLIFAAVLGDTVNYWIGRKMGLAAEKVTWINQQHLLKAQLFYDQHGNKTIVLARFVPIIRSFAPFVAGIGRMNYVQFLSFNIMGGVAWVVLCGGVGYFFGNIPMVKQNFELVIIGIIVISFLPVVFEYIKAKRAT
jgi:membrane-associated protein